MITLLRLTFYEESVLLLDTNKKVLNYWLSSFLPLANN